MSVLGIVNSDPDVKKLIESVFESTEKTNHSLRFLANKDEIIQFLYYELPEIVIINFSDPAIPLEDIISKIFSDKWFSNFGIVGVFSHDKDNEEAILSKYKAINVLTVLEKSRIRSHLKKNIKILEENYQIIFQRGFAKDLVYSASGAFVLDNDLMAVPLYAGIGATILSQSGCISPEKKMYLQLALDELLVNAIEHGNCKISYEEKTRALETGESVVELVAAKSKNRKMRAKKVEFQWEIHDAYSAFTIKDEGDGFDVKSTLKKIEADGAKSLHGRGIRMAKMFSSSIKYNTKGNKVSLIVKHDSPVEHEVPLGFSKEQIISVKKGDTVLRENDPSDYLYYIASGKYTVHHKRKQVGTLSPQDIFMGEMSFLLGQERSASVRAATAGKLILLTRKSFINILREFPHYSIFVSKLLAKRLVRSNEKIAVLLKQVQAQAKVQLAEP